MPRTRQQNEQLREERRQEILTAAIHLFATNGFAETGMSAVARAAGVSHGTVFLYFPTKEDLFRAALLEPLAETERAFFAALAEPGTPLERIERMVRQQVALAARQESYIRLTQYILGRRDRYPDLAGALAGFAHRLVAGLAATIAEGQATGQLAPGHPAHIAGAYYAFLNGAVLIFDRPEGHPDWEESIRCAMRLFGSLPPAQ